MARKARADEKIILRVGEATVASGLLCAEPEVIIGERDGPVGYAFSSAIAEQSVGHTRFLALLDVNWIVRPPTLMVSKVTMKDLGYVRLFGGFVQVGIAKGVLDAVREGIIPKKKVNDLVIIALLWLNMKAREDDPNLDKYQLMKNNREAMKLAIQRAMENKPTIDELFANEEKIKHVYIAQYEEKMKGKTG